MKKKENPLFGALRPLDVDIDGTLSRFVENEELYEKFLRRYPDDGLLPPIMEAFENKDEEALLKTLHKMKGTSMNLGINRISEQCKDIATVIRGKEKIDLTPFIEKLKGDFNEVCETIINT
ncbi:MAG: Hpt domain-containing protein [Oscillospiraceae bacterium]|nr:Hpt domain-containing protein [Oscillospiraceae bacterium]